MDILVVLKCIPSTDAIESVRPCHIQFYIVNTDTYQTTNRIDRLNYDTKNVSFYTLFHTTFTYLHHDVHVQYILTLLEKVIPTSLIKNIAQDHLYLSGDINFGPG